MKGKKPYRKESDMYPEVCSWLESFLNNHRPKSTVKVYDTSWLQLYRFIQQEKLEAFFPHYLTYEIQVDITGTVQKGGCTELALVECKLQLITLRDVSQIIGYSRVAKPAFAFLVSPQGNSRAITHLLQVYQRFDILEYDQGKMIRIARWNPERQEIVAASMLPPGSL